MKRKTRSDMIFDAVVTLICLMCMLVVLYPLYFCVIASVSDPTAIANGQVILLPHRVTWAGYRFLFMDSRVYTGYINTLFYTLGSTLLGLALTIPAGYALSRPDLKGRKWILMCYVFTMYFSGGMIPTYILVRDLGLVDQRITVILMGSFTVYNLLVTRTFFANTLPMELWEAAEIDGCSNGRYFVSVVLPLSTAIIAVIALYYCVAQWNDYMTSLIYLNTQSKYSLQMFLREILLAGQNIAAETTDPDELLEANKTAQTIKYAVIIVATVPMLMIYPFLQRFFVKGVMLGAIKG
ncbi:MAG: carbohydrate ABC transporter permease [Aristaeellaceae bacterium]